MNRFRAIGAALIILALQGCAPLVTDDTAGGIATPADKHTPTTLIDDEEIELKIAGALDNNRETRTAHINVTSFNGIVLLSGEVPTPALRAAVEAIALKTDKVREVHDELTVGPNSSFSSRTLDTWITTKIVSKLVADQGTAAAHIKVITEAGTVFLMGRVNRTQAARAIAAARTTSDVKRIITLFQHLD